MLNFSLPVFLPIWFDGGTDGVMFPIDALAGKRRECAFLLGSTVRLRRFLNYCSVILYFCGLGRKHRRTHCLLCWERGERGNWELRRRLDGLVGEEFLDLLLGRIESSERLGSDWVGF